MHEVLAFLTQLRDNNNREWFEANRKTYEKTRDTFHTFVGDLLKEMVSIDPELARLETKNCIFRIFRDVRFSKDKTPYKKNYSAYFSPDGKQSLKAGYYLHIEPDGKSMLAGGMYMPPAEQLKKIRQEIDYNGAAFREIIEAPAFKKQFGWLTGEKLKTMPKGYSADHPDGELLKHKDFTVVHYVSDTQVATKDFIPYIKDVWQTMKPFNHFLNTAIE
jgi:uncharacterized protein (TIGR02453 family)